MSVSKPSPEDDIRELLEAVAAYSPRADVALVRNACNYAASALAGLGLRNGAPALSRPMAVARTLARLCVDETVIAAGLLYDVALNRDDRGAAYEDIRNLLGKEVADIVDGAVKCGRGKLALEKTLPEQTPGDHTRKVQLALSADIRVLLVMLADRVYELHSLDYLPEHKREPIIREAVNIHLPLVRLMGLGLVQEELEGCIFRQRLPDACRRIGDWLEKRRRSDEKSLREAEAMLRERLEATGIQARMKSGIKPPHSIHKERTAWNLDLDEISAVVVTVIVKDIRECYETLGLAFFIWKPFIDRFRDCITAPAPGRSRGLHATVFGPGGQRLDLHIATEALARQAERGLLTSWWDEEGGLIDPGCRFGQLREMLEMAPHPRQPSRIRAAGSDIIGVLTPKGAVLDLPKGATPVDFAYRIHTELGNYCVGAKVNGRLMPLGTELHRGDIVEIFTHPEARPSRDLLEIVKTGKARKCIRRFLRMEER